MPLLTPLSSSMMCTTQLSFLAGQPGVPKGDKIIKTHDRAWHFLYQTHFDN
jgi:hypothetical protein